MIPFFPQPTLHLGPLTIHAFGVCVALAVWSGTRASERGFLRDGLDAGIGARLAGWILLGGMIGAHLFSILFYVPHKLMSDPWLLLRVWEDISSFGGMLGGLSGALLFMHASTGQAVWTRRWDYLGVVARTFPVSLAIGRMGCALAHDHPGTTTVFPLAISLRSADAMDFIRNAYNEAALPLNVGVSQPTPTGFHDLGWYEFLFLALVVVPLFQLWQRRDRPGGFYLIAFPLLYLPVRFGLDFLRIVDVRYAGLTPAQWVAAFTLVLVTAVAARHHRHLLTSSPR